MVNLLFFGIALVLSFAITGCLLACATGFIAVLAEKWHPKRRRALALLKKVVRPGEWQEFQCSGTITLAKATGTYTLREEGRTQVEGQGKKGHYCLVLQGGFFHPLDRVAAEYLLIVHDEPRYLATANYFND